MTDAKMDGDRRGNGEQGDRKRRALSEIKKELLQEMRKKLAVELEIHYLLAEMLERVTD